MVARIEQLGIEDVAEEKSLLLIQEAIEIKSGQELRLAIRIDDKENSVYNDDEQSQAEFRIAVGS
jgi:hypothetical protein